MFYQTVVMLGRVELNGKVVCAGSWDSDAQLCQPAYRCGWLSILVMRRLGFEW